MNKLGWIGLGATALTALAASAAAPQDRPVGVDEQDWVQISERFGFVVEETRAFPIPGADVSRQILIAPPETVSPILMPPTNGYFVVKTSMGWRRVAISADAVQWLPLSDR